MVDEVAVLRVALSSPPASTDDPHAMDLSTVLVTSAVFETPCELADGDDTVKPVVFADSLLRTGRLSWRGTVIEDLRLSNGDVLSASELVEHLKTAPAMKGVHLSSEGNTISFETRQPEDAFPTRLISRSTLLAVVRDGTHLGTGPFRIVQNRPSEIILEPNPHHRRRSGGSTSGARTPDRIEFSVHPRDDSGAATSLIDALNRGEVDFTMELTRDEVEQVQRVRCIFRPGDSTCLLSFNTIGAFSDERLRHAAAMAIDRHALADLCYQNPVAYVARGVLPPQLGRMRDDLSFNLDAAKANIEGRAPSRPLKMLRVWAPRPYLPRPQDVGRAIVQQLGRIGLEVEDAPASGAESYHESLSRGEYDMVLGGWMADTGNAAEFMHSLLHSSMVPTRNQTAATACNMPRLADRVLDDLIDAALHDGTDASLMAVQRRVDEIRPLVPLMYGPSVAVHARRVRGLEWKDRRLPDFASVELADL